jgi:hypothetical protein
MQSNLQRNRPVVAWEQRKEASRKVNYKGALENFWE